MECWKCGKTLEDPKTRLLPFRATCDYCHAWLHCCKNCKNYKPGLPNDCMIPGTEYIADREACNFCDSFELKGKAPEKNGSALDASKRLFGEEQPHTKKDFKDLFHD